MNILKPLTLALTCLALSLGGCGKDEHDDHDHDHDHGKHSQDKGHDGHDHGDDHGHKGEKHKLGGKKAGDLTVSVTQIGDIKSGEGILAIKVTGGSKGATTVRCWAGTEDGKGSVKAKADYSADHDEYDAHVEVPAKLSEGAAWWIELDTGSGSKQSVSFPIEK